MRVAWLGSGVKVNASLEVTKLSDMLRSLPGILKRFRQNKIEILHLLSAHLKAPSVSAAIRAAAAASNSAGVIPMASCISVVAAAMKSSSMCLPSPCSRNTRPTNSMAGLTDFWPRPSSGLRVAGAPGLEGARLINIPNIKTICTTGDTENTKNICHLSAVGHDNNSRVVAVIFSPVFVMNFT